MAVYDTVCCPTRIKQLFKTIDAFYVYTTCDGKMASDHPVYIYEETTAQLGDPPIVHRNLFSLKWMDKVVSYQKDKSIISEDRRSIIQGEKITHVIGKYVCSPKRGYKCNFELDAHTGEILCLKGENQQDIELANFPESCNTPYLNSNVLSLTKHPAFNVLRIKKLQSLHGSSEKEWGFQVNIGGDTDYAIDAYNAIDAYYIWKILNDDQLFSCS